VQVIKLQRELRARDKSIEALQAKYELLSADLEAANTRAAGMEQERERHEHDLRASVDTAADLRQRLTQAALDVKAAGHKDLEIRQLTEECRALQDANGKLVAAAFDAERDAERERRDQALRTRVAQLEKELSEALEAKASALSRLSEETTQHAQRQQAYRELHARHLSLRDEHEKATERLRFFTRESAIDMGELEQALLLVRTKQERSEAAQRMGFAPPPGEPDDDMLEAAGAAAAEAELKALQAANAEVALDLDKARKMLRLEHALGKERAAKMAELERQMQDMATQHRQELEELARLADSRAHRITQLQAQLRDVSYGTHQHRIPSDDPLAAEDAGELGATLPPAPMARGGAGPSAARPIDLAHGENVVEVHVSRVEISAEGAALLPTQNPSLFVTYDFYEHPTQATPVRMGLRPVYDHTSQYVVTVNEVFVRYLMKGAMTVELHQAIGTSFTTRAAAQVRLQPLLADGAGAAGRRVAFTVALVAMEDPTVLLATLHVWLRMHVAMERAFRLYQQRLKAGHALANPAATPGELRAAAATSLAVGRDVSRANAVLIDVVGADVRPAQETQLQGKARRDVDGAAAAPPPHVPSLYVAYRFFNEPNHATRTVSRSLRPVFHSHQAFLVQEDEAMQQYLEDAELAFCVVDDEDPDPAHYFGVARARLRPLLLNEGIEENLTLLDAEGRHAGTVFVRLRWQRPYGLPPESESALRDAQLAAARAEAPVPAPRPTEAAVRRSPAYEVPVRAPGSRGDADEAEDMGTVYATPVPPAPNRPSLQEREADTGEGEGEADVKKVVSEVQRGAEARAKRGEQASRFPLHDVGSGGGRDEEHEGAADSNGGSPSANMPAGNTDSAAARRDAAAAGTAGTGDMEADLAARFDSQRAAPPHTPAETPASTQAEDVKGATGTSHLKTAQSAHSGTFASSALTFEGTGTHPAPEAEETAPRQKMSSAEAPPMVIEIGPLQLPAASPLLRDSDAHHLFVSYDFLGVHPARLETPSETRPEDGGPLPFDHKMRFRFDLDEDPGGNVAGGANLRKALKAVAKTIKRDKRYILSFEVVSEPFEEEAAQVSCRTVGVAFVDLARLLAEQHDIEAENVPVLDPDVPDAPPLGYLQLSVYAKDALGHLLRRKSRSAATTMT
jgi:protein fantom